MIWLGALIVQVPLTTTKIALLLFYKRIFATQTFRKGVFIGIAAVTVWGVLFFLVSGFGIKWGQRERLTNDHDSFCFSKSTPCHWKTSRKSNFDLIPMP